MKHVWIEKDWPIHGTYTVTPFGHLTKTKREFNDLMKARKYAYKAAGKRGVVIETKEPPQA